MSLDKVSIIGAGLAGSEVAWQLVQRGIAVELYEMRPEVTTVVHKTGDFAELVCSNSLGGEVLATAGGLLKHELEILGSLVLEAAKATSVPAGKALAVNRTEFASYITDKLSSHPLVTLYREEIENLNELTGLVVVASGPLTPQSLSESVRKLTGDEGLYFFDAAAPIVERDSLDESQLFWKSRYNDDDDGDYLNVPLDKDQYEKFWKELVNGEVVPLAEHDKLVLFEGCMPIEELARRGLDTLRYGPFRPVGLEQDGKRAWAVMQLRKENKEGSLLNLVGCQTRLKWGEQARVFRILPGFADAEFVRYGVMHRNTYLNSPKLLNPNLSLRTEPNIYFAGQITGVEGYMESAATGVYVGLNLARLLQGQAQFQLPPETLLGSLISYITEPSRKSFQPMNANYGLLLDLKEKIRSKKERKLAKANRSLTALQHFAKKFNI